MDNTPGGISFVYVFYIYKTGKESQYIVLPPGTGSDPPIGSDRESGCDKLVSESRFRRFWMSLR